MSIKGVYSEFVGQISKITQNDITIHKIFTIIVLPKKLSICSNKDF